MVTVNELTTQSVNSALLRNGKGDSATTFNQIENVTNINKTKEVLKLSSGETLDVKTLLESNKSLVTEIESLRKQNSDISIQLQRLRNQVENISLTSEDGGKTLIFQNWLGIDFEQNVPVVVAEYSSNGIDWHSDFQTSTDIYIRFSYDEGGTWTDAIKIVGEDGSSYAYYGLVTNLNQIPSTSTGNFFLSGETFYASANLMLQPGNGDKSLVLNNEHLLALTRPFQKGVLYVFDGITWQGIYDRNNFRYVIAMNDLITIGEPLSPGLLEQFQSSIVEYTPCYLGSFPAPPTNPNEGDTFCYSGTTTLTYTQGMCYRYTRHISGTTTTFTWDLLDPNSASSKETYMSALSDILKGDSKNVSQTFANIFVGNIFASDISTNTFTAFGTDVMTPAIGGAINGLEQEIGINDLQDKTIIDGGYIKTSLIEVDVLRAGLVSTQSIQSGDGTFTGLRADDAILTNVTAENGIYTNITAEKAVLSNTLLRLSSYAEITFLSTDTHAQQLANFEAARETLYNRFGNIQGIWVTGQFAFTISYGLHGIPYKYWVSSPIPAMRVTVNSNILGIMTGSFLCWDRIQETMMDIDFVVNYQKNTNEWNIRLSGSSSVYLPSDEVDNYSINLIFRF